MIPISEYDEQSMVLAKPIYDARKRILLASGQRIHARLVARLQQLGISFAFIEDEPSRDITMEEMIDMPTWMDVVSTIEAVFAAVSQSRPIPVKELFAAAGKLWDEIRNRPVVTTIPINTLPNELQLAAHSVNVAIVSMLIARNRDFNDLHLRDLTIGCLLHDIGKAVTDRKELHPEAGFQIIRKQKEISLMSAHVAYQHHEMIDGQGFPRGIQGNAFLEYAQICSLANLYDHLISEDGMPSHLAAEKLMTLGGSSVTLSIIQTFLKSVPQYFPGTRVKLSNGEEAIVTRIRNQLQRPYVRIQSSGEEISLADHPNLVVISSR